jgi:hypothetical protein
LDGDGPGEGCFHYRAFGIALRSSLLLPGLRPGKPVAKAVRLSTAGYHEIDARWSGSMRNPAWETRIDGRPYGMEVGCAGDHLMRWGHDVFHLSADGARLICTPSMGNERRWQRFLLDTVLWSVSLLAGFEQLHGSAVAGDRGVICVLGPSGAGKSSVAAELVRRGLPLFSDDILALHEEGRQLRAHPGPALMNLANNPTSGVAPADVGEPLADFGAETWVALPDSGMRPCGLAAICVLDRRRGNGSALEPLQPTVLDLMPYSLGFPHLQRRVRSRFRLVSRVAAEVPVFRLSAEPSAPPSRLADLVEPLARPVCVREPAVRTSSWGF